MECDRPRQQGAPGTSRSAGKSAQGLIWGHEQWVWDSTKLYWVLLGQIWAGNRTNLHGGVSNTQLSQMPFILPKTLGYFLLWVINLTAPLLHHLFTVSVATHYHLYSSVVTDLLMGDLEINIHPSELRQFISREENSGLRGMIKSLWHKKFVHAKFGSIAVGIRLCECSQPTPHMSDPTWERLKLWCIMLHPRLAKVLNGDNCSALPHRWQLDNLQSRPWPRNSCSTLQDLPFW